MVEVKGTALVKARDRYKKLIKVFPDRREFYETQIAEVNEKITLAKVCKRCGRPLKDEHAMELGYGKECAAKAEAEASEEMWDESSV